MSMRLRVSLAVGIAAIGLAAIAAAGYGDPSDLAVTPLVGATLDGPVHARHGGIEITTKGRRDTLMARLDFADGGTTGWHTHPGPVIVGSQAARSRCATSTTACA